MTTLRKGKINEDDSVSIKYRGWLTLEIRSRAPQERQSFKEDYSKYLDILNLSKDIVKEKSGKDIKGDELLGFVKNFSLWKVIRVNDFLYGEPGYRDIMSEYKYNQAIRKFYDKEWLRQNPSQSYYFY